MPAKMRRNSFSIGVALALGLYVLGFYSRTDAQVPNAPFANAVEQQAEIIAQLKTLNALVKEQNSLLASGQLQVTIAEKKAQRGTPAPRSTTPHPTR